MAKQKYWNGTAWEIVGTDADKVSIKDTANKFTATNVEAALLELFTDVSDGKKLVRNSITGRGGVVADADGDGIPTFTELQNGINLMKLGDAAVNELIPIEAFREVLPNLTVAQEWNNQNLTSGGTVKGGGIQDTDGSIYIPVGRDIERTNENFGLIWRYVTPVNDGAVDAVLMNYALRELFVIMVNGYTYRVHVVNADTGAIKRYINIGLVDWLIFSAAVDNSSNLYTIGRYANGNIVKKYNASGLLQWDYLVNLYNGGAIAVDPVNGDVFCTYRVTSLAIIHKLNTSGVFLAAYTVPGSAVQRLVVAPHTGGKQCLYIQRSTDYTITVLDTTDLSVVETTYMQSGSNYVLDFKVDRSGAMYYAYLVSSEYPNKQIGLVKLTKLRLVMSLNTLMSNSTTLGIFLDRQSMHPKNIYFHRVQNYIVKIKNTAKLLSW